MNRTLPTTTFFASLLLGLPSLSANLTYTEPAPTIPAVMTEMSKTFEQKVYQVSPSVYSAVGWGLANMAMIVGGDGIVLVDTGMTLSQGEQVLAEFRKITNKPVKGIIYTHHHIDHWAGVGAFTTEEAVKNGEVTIAAHADFMQQIQDEPGLLYRIINPRTAVHAGSFLPKGPDGFVNNGCCGYAEMGPRSFIAPTVTFEDSLDIEMAGVKLHLMHAPSETRDEIAVWMPSEKVMFSADIIEGEAYPNLNSLRGTRFRDYQAWYKSVDRMRSKDPHHLVPGHGRPLSGQAEVSSMLTNYRDGIQYVWDQGIRYMNKGYSADQLVETIKLPTHLANEHWLREIYGTVPVSLQGLYSGLIGWFNGEIWKLDPAPLQERLQNYVKIMGGRDNILSTAKESVANGNPMWGLELLSYPLKLNPKDQEVRTLAAHIIEQWAYKQENSAYRNWALSSARELRGLLPTKSNVGFFSSAIVMQKSSYSMLDFLSIRLKAENTLNVVETAGFYLTDTDEKLGLIVRRGVAEAVEAYPVNPSVVVALTKTQFYRLAVMSESLTDLLQEDGVKLVGGTAADAVRFFGYFEEQPEEYPPVTVPVTLK
jgi:linear primary-alkylsulfatase